MSAADLLLMGEERGRVFPPSPANCVLYYPGYPPQGATIRDWSGQGNDGTITGATWTRLSSGLWYLDYNGSSNVTTKTTETSLNVTGNITFLAWVNPDNFTTDYKTIFSKFYDGTYDEYVYQFSLTITNGEPFYFMRNSSNESEAKTATDKVTANIWSLVGMTISGTALTFSINGVADSGGAQTLSYTRDTNTGDLLMGVEDPLAATPQWFDGGIALPRIRNVAASETLSYYQRERSLFGV